MTRLSYSCILHTYLIIGFRLLWSSEKPANPCYRSEMNQIICCFTLLLRGCYKKWIGHMINWVSDHVISCCLAQSSPSSNGAFLFPVLNHSSCRRTFATAKFDTSFLRSIQMVHECYGFLQALYFSVAFWF